MKRKSTWLSVYFCQRPGKLQLDMSSGSPVLSVNMKFMAYGTAIPRRLLMPGKLPRVGAKRSGVGALKRTLPDTEV